jgi:hypothetical protein
MISLNEFWALGPGADLRDNRLVQSRRQHANHLHAAGELVMLLGRDLARDEDAEMPDRLVQRVDDGLAIRDDFLLVVIARLSAFMSRGRGSP